MELDFWINAFISDEEPTAFTLKRGPNAGRKAIGLPASAFLNPLNLGKLNLGGLTRKFLRKWDSRAHTVAYLTDERGFTSRRDEGVTQRIHAHLKINPETGEVLEFDHKASDTVEVSVASGKEVARDTAKLKWRSSWSKGLSFDNEDGSTTHYYYLRANGSDPLVWGASLRPLSFGGKLVVRSIPREDGQPPKVETSFEGHATRFPWFEAYASMGADTQSLFRLKPPPGTTIETLLRGAEDGRLDGKVTLDAQNPAPSPDAPETASFAAP